MVSRRADKAFALVDVIVATIIVGVSLAVIVGLIGRALSSQKRGEELSIAAGLADESLQMVLARGPDDYARRFPVQGPCEPPFQDYGYKLAFTGGGSVGAPYTVTCTISWGGIGRGATAAGGQSIVIQTLMASRNGGPDGLADPERRPDESVDRQAEIGAQE